MEKNELFNITKEKRRKPRWMEEKVDEPPTEQLEQIKVKPLREEATEVAMDQFFEKLEKKMFIVELGTRWQGDAAREHMEGYMGVLWDKARLAEEEVAKGRYKPSYAMIRDRMITERFPATTLRNKILTELFHPSAMPSVKAAALYIKALARQWARLRERARWIGRLDPNLLKRALFGMLPRALRPLLQSAADDPDVSYPKFKSLLMMVAGRLGIATDMSTDHMSSFSSWGESPRGSEGSKTPKGDQLRRDSVHADVVHMAWEKQEIDRLDDLKHEVMALPEEQIDVKDVAPIEVSPVSYLEVEPVLDEVESSALSYAPEDDSGYREEDQEGEEPLEGSDPAVEADLAEEQSAIDEYEEHSVYQSIQEEGNGSFAMSAHASHEGDVSRAANEHSAADKHGAADHADEEEDPAAKRRATELMQLQTEQDEADQYD